MIATVYVSYIMSHYDQEAYNIIYNSLYTRFILSVNVKKFRHNINVKPFDPPLILGSVIVV